MDDRLSVAFHYCAEVTRRHSKSFYFSTGLLPRAKCQAVRALYAFSRLSDNIVDEVSTATTMERRLKLDSWRTAMRLPPAEQEHPVLLAWAEVRDKYGIPIQYSEDLLDGMQMDLEQTRYETFQQLRLYCYRVASSVGINSMYIVGFDDCSETFAAADDLGVALQLTNILRDVGQDLGLGRVYIPQEDLRRFRYREEDLAAGIVDQRYRALVDFQIDRANALYDRGWQGFSRLDKDGRLAIASAAEFYRAILRKLVAWDYDNFRRRAYLNRWEKLVLIPRVWWQVRGLDRLETTRKAQGTEQ